MPDEIMLTLQYNYFEDAKGYFENCISFYGWADLLTPNMTSNSSISVLTVNVVLM